MAPLPPPPQFTAQVSVWGVSGSIPIANTFTLRLANAAGDPTSIAIEVATFMHNTFTTRFTQLLSSQYTQKHTDVLYWYGTPTPAQATGQGDQIGGQTGLGDTNNSAMLVSWKQPARYRGGHPRNYFGPLPQSAIGNPTQWTTATVTGWQSGATGFLNDVNGHTGPLGGIYQLGYLKRYRSHVLLQVPEFYHYTSATAHALIATQRARLRITRN